MPPNGPLWNDADLAAHLGVSREDARKLLREVDRASGGALLVPELRWSFFVGTLARLRPDLVAVENEAALTVRLESAERKVAAHAEALTKTRRMLTTNEIAVLYVTTRKRQRS